MDDLIEKIFTAGVVGCGGAGFPTHAKLAASARWYIVNAAECEPLLRTDRHVMLRHTKELVETAGKIGKHLRAEKTVIALKKNYTEEIAMLQDACSEASSPVQLYLMDNFYPAGDEQMIVQRVTGATVPPAGLPLEVGAVVSNAATVLAIADALHDIPLTHKYITITGYIESTVVLRAPVGTSVADCLRMCGWKVADKKRVIIGGPLMGRVLGAGLEEATPITKTTSGLVVVRDDSPLVRLDAINVEHTINRARAACIQCNQCTMMCPRHLLGHSLQPHQMMRYLGNSGNIDDMIDDPAVQQALLCCECGVCEIFACPMGLQPRRVNQIFKRRLIERGIKYQRKETEWPTRQELEYRLIPSKRMAARAGVLSYYDRDPSAYLDVVPERLVFPLKQHIGAPSLPVVTVGERVKAGQLIAECPQGKLGANIHCGVQGRIEMIDEAAITVVAS